MQRSWWLVGGLTVLIVLFAFVFLVPHTSEQTRVQESAASTTPSIFVHDAYRKGTHTLTVAIGAPNPCTSVTAQASVIPGASSTPDSIIIEVDMPLDTGICLEEPATTTVTLTAAASAKASIQANINGSTTPVIAD